MFRVLSRWSFNLSWGMQFRTCENFWDSADHQSSVYPKNSHKYKSHTAITSMVASSYRSRKSLRIVICVANQLRLKRKILPFRFFVRFCNAKSKKFLLLLAFAKSRIFSPLPTSINQAGQGSRIHIRIRPRFCNAESYTQSTKSQNPTRSAQKFLLRFAFAKSRILSRPRLQPTKKGQFAESADSA